MTRAQLSSVLAALEARVDFLGVPRSALDWRDLELLIAARLEEAEIREAFAVRAAPPSAVQLLTTTSEEPLENPSLWG